MDVDDYTQPVEAVVAQERAAIYPVPLKARSYVELFTAWLQANPKAAREMECIALAINARGLKVSTKYLIERQRYEGRSRLVPVPYIDQHTATATNTASTTPLRRFWRAGCSHFTRKCA